MLVLLYAAMRPPATGTRTSTALGALALGGLALATGVAHGRPRLSVARGEQAMACPDTAALAAQVEAVLGRPALSQPRPGGPELGLDVEIASEGEGFGATVRVTGSRQGKRQLHDAGPGCTGLGEALAVTLAMLLDEHDPPPRPAPSAAPTAPAAPPTASGAPAAPPPAPGERRTGSGLATSLGLWAGGGVGVALTPSTEGMVAGGAWLALGRRWSVGLDVLWLPSTRTDLGRGSVRVSLTGGTARGCWRAVDASVALDACAVLAAGAFRAEGESFRVTRVARPTWAAGGLGLGASGGLGVPRLSWRVRVDGLVTAREQSFRVLDVGTTPALSRVGLTAVAGLGVSLW